MKLKLNSSAKVFYPVFVVACALWAALDIRRGYSPFSRGFLEFLAGLLPCTLIAGFAAFFWNLFRSKGP
jgi:hypothetical protein